jgi:hypothetical protein
LRRKFPRKKAFVLLRTKFSHGFTLTYKDKSTKITEGYFYNTENTEGTEIKNNHYYKMFYH